MTTTEKTAFTATECIYPGCPMVYDPAEAGVDGGTGWILPPGEVEDDSPVHDHRRADLTGTDIPATAAAAIASRARVLAGQIAELQAAQAAAAAGRWTLGHEARKEWDKCLAWHRQMHPGPILDCGEVACQLTVAALVDGTLGRD